MGELVCGWFEFCVPSFESKHCSPSVARFQSWANVTIRPEARGPAAQHGSEWCRSNEFHCALHRETVPDESAKEFQFPRVLHLRYPLAFSNHQLSLAFARAFPAGTDR